MDDETKRAARELVERELLANAGKGGAATEMAGAMMVVAEMVEPMHEWLAAERQYFLDQGYTPDEARAMSAASYLIAFGGRISPAPDDDDEQQP